MKLSKAKDQLAADPDRQGPVTPQELAAALNMRLPRVLELQRLGRKPLTLDEPAGPMAGRMDSSLPISQVFDGEDGLAYDDNVEQGEREASIKEVTEYMAESVERGACISVRVMFYMGPRCRVACCQPALCLKYI
jgi:hypothetical protein